MFCKNCGEEISEKAFVCPHCGALTNENNVAQNNTAQGVHNEAGFLAQGQNFAIMSFIFSFFIGAVGLVLSAISLNFLMKADQKSYPAVNFDRDKKFSIAAIVISSLSIISSFVVTIVVLNEALILW